MTGRTIGGLCLMLAGLTGCAAARLDAGFGEVRREVQERSATRIEWRPGVELEPGTTEALRALLGRPLTADVAVQIAMLNNRELQALYADLGVAEADLVAAGLFRNPVLDAAVLFPLSGARPDLQLGVVVGFLDALYVPLRKRVATARFEEAKLRVTGAVMDMAGRAREAFYAHQATEQVLDLRRTIAEALIASFEVSRRLHEAGNISDLDLARDRAGTEASRLALRSAEIAARLSRERLNELLGLWGAETAWEVDARLPEIPAEPLPVDDLERTALSRSVDLAQARQRIIAMGQQLGYDRATSWLPELDLGVEAEREEGWKLGPVLSVPIPLFNQGQARVGRAMVELRRAQQEHYALAVKIRAAARAARDRVAGARDRALYYRDILLPLQERIVNEAQLQYNAMQLGIVQLLRDRERQIESGVAYVEALREYWVARADVMQIASGRLPAANGRRIGGAGEPNKEDGNGH